MPDKERVEAVIGGVRGTIPAEKAFEVAEGETEGVGFVPSEPAPPVDDAPPPPPPPPPKPPPPPVKPPAPPVETHPLKKAERGFTKPVGGKVVERDAKGRATVYEAKGERYYTPDNPMWGMGYRTATQYRTVERTVVTDPATGREKAIFTGGAAADSGFPAPYVAVDGKHISRAEAVELGKLKGEELFDAQVTLGLIPKGTRYVPPEMITKAITALKPFKTPEGTYRLAEAIKRKVTPVYLDLMFGKEVVAEVRGAQKQVGEFEAGLKVALPKLYQIYEKEGYDAYIKAFEASHIKLPDDKWIDIKQFNALPENYRDIGIKRGFDAILSTIKADEARQKAIIATMDEKYQVDGGYNLPLALKDKAVTARDLEFIGFKKPDVDRAVSTVKASIDTRVAMAGERTWLDVGTGKTYSDKVKEALIKKDPLMRDRLVLAPPSARRLGLQLVSFIAPATRAALPEYNIKDISAVEWGLTGVNIALIGTAFAPGAIMGALAGKVAVTGISTTGAGLLGYHTARNWADLSPLQRGVGVAGSLLYALPMMITVGRGVQISSVKVPVKTGMYEMKPITGELAPAVIEAPAWKGLSIFKNPVLGKSGGKWVLGGRNITLPEARLILEGYHPEAMLDTKVFVNPPALTKAGFSPTQIKYISDTLKARNLFAGKKSPYLSKDALIEPTAYIDADEMTIFMRQMIKYHDKVKQFDMLYGGTTIKAQLAPEYRGWRQTHDIDMNTTFNLAEAKAFNIETIALFKKLPSKHQYRLSPKSPMRIEKLVKGKWEHISDMKSDFVDPKLQVSELASSKLDATGAYSYGRMVAEPVVTVKYPGIGKIDIMALSESGVRKADTILRVRQVGIARLPEISVAKGIYKTPKALEKYDTFIYSSKTNKVYAYGKDFKIGDARQAIAYIKQPKIQGKDIWVGHERIFQHPKDLLKQMGLDTKTIGQFDDLVRGRYNANTQTVNLYFDPDAVLSLTNAQRVQRLADALRGLAKEGVPLNTKIKVGLESAVTKGKYLGEYLKSDTLGGAYKEAMEILGKRVLTAETAFRPPQRGIAKPGVPKDAADFYVIVQTYEKAGILKAGTSEAWLRSWAKAMGYTEAQLVKLMPNLKKAAIEVAGKSPSNLIGYRFTPASSTKVSPGATPTITIRIPSSLGASVSGSLEKQISSPVSLYKPSPTARASISATASKIVPPGYPTMVSLSTIRGLSPSAKANISASVQRTPPSISSSPSPKPSPPVSVISPKPSPVPPSKPPSVPPSIPPSVPPSKPPSVPPSKPPSVPPSIPPSVPPPSVPPSVTPIPPPTPPPPPPPIKPPPPLPAVRMVKGRVPIEQGSIAFAMGMRKGARGVKVPQWYYIPPPYTMRKPISLSAPPLGAVRTDSASPYDTIQTIGRSRRYKVPASVSIDMGVTDVLITNYGRKISFGGKGEKTDVGIRMPSPTKGMSIPASEDLLLEELLSGKPVSSQGISRPVKTKKKPRRKVRREDDFSDLTSVRGIRW